MKLKRRDFIYTAALTGAGLMMTPGFAFAKRRADSRLRLGFIGVGLRGTMTPICHVPTLWGSVCREPGLFGKLIATGFTSTVNQNRISGMKRTSS